MIHGRLYTSIALACSFSFFATAAVVAQPAIPTMRISTENTEAHVHTRILAEFTENVARRLEGLLAATLFSDARLYRDTDVPSALRAGRLEMAVPGIWHLDRYAPDLAVFLLPSFYGAASDETRDLVDGELGRELNSKLEAELNVVVLGRWLDLGHAHLFSIDRPITSADDLTGMIVRVAGGRGNELRLAALGARPVSIPWPDLPAALARGRIEAILTTYETVASARLWEHGIRYVYEDSQHFSRYIPMVSAPFWRRLSPDVQSIVREEWEALVDTARTGAAAAQSDARARLLAHGVVIHVPGAETLLSTRAMLLVHEASFARQLSISPAVLETATYPR